MLPQFLRRRESIAIDTQTFTWRDMTRLPINSVDDDAYTRMRLITMHALEQDAYRFHHVCGHFDHALQWPMARLRRVEHHQQTLLINLLAADATLIESALAYEQTAVEITAMLAQRETDAYLAQVYRFGLLENLDHLYRFAALLHRLTGEDPDRVVQCYTDITPGRATQLQHREPADDLRECYDRRNASLATKIWARTALALASSSRDAYLAAASQLHDKTARLLFAEIASVKEQHATQYAALIDPGETWLERLMLHEACELYHYEGCIQTETQPRIKAIWERFAAYEAGHVKFACELFSRMEQRNPIALLGDALPAPLSYTSQRTFIRDVLAREVDLRAAGTRFVDRTYERSEAPGSLRYRDNLNREGSPSQQVATGFHARTRDAEWSALPDVSEHHPHPSGLQ